MTKKESRQFSIVADVGGTHIRFATLLETDAQLQCIQSYRCADFEHLPAILDYYLGRLTSEYGIAGNPQHLCLALPGAIHRDPVELVNLPWSVSPAALRAAYGCDLLLLNDFTAQALAIAEYKAADLQWIRTSDDSIERATRAVIGPGTGLGAAALLPSGEVLESEAGHCGFAPVSPLQQALLKQLWQLYPRISVERLVSGPGLANIYRGLQMLAGNDLQLTPEQVTAGACEGDLMCCDAVTEFTRIFGAVCGDIALAFGAVGGIYLSGGLLNQLGSQFNADTFLEQFNNKGRFESYCQSIPIAVVLSSQPGLLGAARHLRLNTFVSH